MTVYDIIIKPLITEKTNLIGGRVRDNVRGPKVFFQVHPRANKLQIKQAVESLYNVKVLDVNTQMRLGKTRRMGMRYGKQGDTKKAIVTLHPDYTLDLF